MNAINIEFTLQKYLNEIRVQIAIQKVLVHLKCLEQNK